MLGSGIPLSPPRAQALFIFLNAPLFLAAALRYNPYTQTFFFQMMHTASFDTLVEHSLSALCDTGIAHLPQAFTSSFCNLLLQEAKERSYHTSHVGAQRTHNSAIRSDTISWLDTQESTPATQEYVQFLQQFSSSLKEQLFLPLSGWEGHFTHYAKGSAYHQHIDNPKGSNRRILTCILYLNPAWQPDHAGQLEALTPQGPLMVSPIMGTFVCFRSDAIPHKVHTCHQERHALTSWLLREQVV